MLIDLTGTKPSDYLEAEWFEKLSLDCLHFSRSKLNNDGEQFGIKFCKGSHFLHLIQLVLASFLLGLLSIFTNHVNNKRVQELTRCESDIAVVRVLCQVDDSGQTRIKININLSCKERK